MTIPFIKKEIAELNYNGWFQSIKATDLDQDGLTNYFIENWRNNNKFYYPE